MKYIFGTDKNNEILKTKGDSHSDLMGWQEIKRDYPGETITDRFRVVRKTKSAEDPEGNCYDWYIITAHYRVIDKSPALKQAEERNAANIDYLSMMVGVELGGGDDEPEV